MYFGLNYDMKIFKKVSITNKIKYRISTYWPSSSCQTIGLIRQLFLEENKIIW